MALEPDIQRITRLTPLDDVLAVIATEVAPVVARPTAVTTSIGRVLAADVVVNRPLPSEARALRDGFAVRSEDTTDASAYAPAPLSLAERIATGGVLPPGADAVAAVDIVTVRSGAVLAMVPVASGEGGLAAGGDVAGGITLLQAGCRITRVHAAVMAAAGFDLLSVRPFWVRVVRARPMLDATIDAIVMHVESAIEAASGILKRGDGSLAELLVADGHDAVIVVGGTGSGRNDAAVQTLAAVGEARVHGIALYPGETAAFGIANGRPVLMLPGRLDAALAVWHLLGEAMLARLCGCIEPLATRSATLTHKITSTVGVSELIPVRCDGAGATPIASGYVPLAALARANGWILVPAEREGFPAGSEVVIRPFP